MGKKTAVFLVRLLHVIIGAAVILVAMYGCVCLELIFFNFADGGEWKSTLFFLTRGALSILFFASYLMVLHLLQKRYPKVTELLSY